VASALVLHTQEDCAAGLLVDWSTSRGVDLDVLRVDRWPRLPDPSGYSFAILLGSDEPLTGSGKPLTGPRHDWVWRELEWIGIAHAAGLPLLGICFGAQALAVALGGSITKLAAPECSWIELETSDAGQIPTGPWLAFRDDAIELPPRGRELARNHAGLQAFAFERHLGVQFHPQVTPTILSRWLGARNERAAIEPLSLLADAHERCRRTAAMAFDLFDGFALRAGADVARAAPRRCTPDLTGGLGRSASRSAPLTITYPSARLSHRLGVADVGAPPLLDPSQPPD
jgi:GMP synthase-like glutamine amidotransferase